MKLVPGHGLEIQQGKILFGMKETDVVKILGEADRKYKDEEGNNIQLYDRYRLRLTYYEDEGFRMGYIIVSHPDTTVDGAKLIGTETAGVLKQLDPQGKIKWEKEYFDMTEHLLDPDRWLTILSEFGNVTKVEAGALIDGRDEFVWRFGKN